MSFPCFFVLGNPRSGTSLFRSLLNAHPHLIVPPECGFILWLEKEWRRSDLSVASTRRDFVAAVMRCRKFETWEMDEGALFDAMNDPPPLDYAEAIDRIVLAYAKARGRSPRMWGDKNNHYASSGSRLHDLFPEARFLHIVRDPRDVAVSYRELARKRIDSVYRPELPVSPEEIAREWHANNTAVLDQVGHLKGYHRLRYEDLVADLQGTMATVFRHLGVDPDVNMSATSHMGGLDEPRSFLQWKEKLMEPVDASSVGRFKEELAPELVEQIVRVAGSLMSEFGYGIAGHESR